MYQFIAIEGNIGAGKTTLADALAKELQAQLVLEEFAENPFLPKFYQEPEKHAFALELSFMAARFQQINQLAVKRELFTNGIVADYFFLKSLLFASITLKEDEYTLFKSLFNIININIPQPDILIYLSAPIPQLMKHIKIRGREYELKITEDYLQSIQESYIHSFKQITNFPVIILQNKNTPFAMLQTVQEILASAHTPGIHFITQ